MRLQLPHNEPVQVLIITEHKPGFLLYRLLYFD